MKIKRFLNKAHSLIMSHIHSNRLKAIQHFEGLVEVPQAFYYPTSIGGRFVYSVGGVQKEIIVAGELDAAIFLKSHNLIHTYVAHKDGGVSMYSLNHLSCNKKGEIFWASQQKVKWNDFQFTRGQAITFAAVHELQLKEQEYGMVVNMFNRYNQAA